jgi:hypothetical protein
MGLTRPALALAVVVALTAVNGRVLGRLVTDPDDTPPLAGWIATAAVLGTPAALAELAAAVVLWHALTT